MKATAIKKDGFVTVETRGREFILNEDEAEDLRLALERLDIREHVEEVLDKNPDDFDFTKGASREDLIDVVVRLALDFTDFSNGTACSETLEDTIYEQAELLGAQS